MRIGAPTEAEQPMRAWAHQNRDAADELAEIAYRCALGGADIVKDDHGLANQKTAPFRERLELTFGVRHREEVRIPYEAVVIGYSGRLTDR